MKKPELTHARLLEVLHYEPSTGVFTWRVTLGSRACAGDVAGTLTLKGYRKIKIDGKVHSAHRLAWLYAHGAWPSGQIDHKFEDKQDNRISELREASHSQNQQNIVAARKGSVSGVRGVDWCAERGQWRARICTAEGRKCLGYSEDLAVATALYSQARSVYQSGHIARGEQ